MGKLRGVLSGQFYYKYHPGTLGVGGGMATPEHAITAHALDAEGNPQPEVIGSFHWSTPEDAYRGLFGEDEHEIKWVQVNPSYQRHGIAKKMLNLAHNLSGATATPTSAESHGLRGMSPVPYAAHSPNLTPEGANWLMKVEGELPDHRMCNECGNVFHTDDIHVGRTGKAYCTECAEDTGLIPRNW